MAPGTERDLVLRRDRGLRVLDIPDRMVPVADGACRGLLASEAVFLAVKVGLVRLYYGDIEMVSGCDNPVCMALAACMDEVGSGNRGGNIRHGLDIMDGGMTITAEGRIGISLFKNCPAVDTLPDLSEDTFMTAPAGG